MSLLHVTGLDEVGSTWVITGLVDRTGGDDYVELDILFDPQKETLNQSLEANDVDVDDQTRRSILERIYPPKPRRQIVKSNRQWRELLPEAVDSLVEQNSPEPELFRRANYIVHVMTDEKHEPVIYDVSSGWAFTHLGMRMDWLKVTQGVAFDDRPDKDVARALSTEGDWPFPPLKGLARGPILRPDGTVLQREGYDPATGLYYVRPAGLRVDVPNEPTREQVHGALRLLDELVVDFEFQSHADKVNYLALLLTPLVRQLVDVVPLALVTGSRPGSGKGLLTQCVTVIHTGSVRGISPLPDRNEDEVRKTVYARLLDGTTFIVWDNVRHLDSDFLKAVLTAPSFSDRQLQYSKVRDMPNIATWVATGNNVYLDAEMTRRSYQIYLEPSVERPDQRTGFKHDPLLAWVVERRNDLLSALLTLVRAWVVAERPAWTGRTMGSFEKWTQVVGGILEVGGVATDFLANMEDLWADVVDETSEELEFMERVWAWKGDGEWDAGDLVASGITLPWPLAQASSYIGQVAYTLRGHKGMVIGPYKLRRVKKGAADTRRVRYRVTRHPTDGTDA